MKTNGADMVIWKAILDVIDLQKMAMPNASRIISVGLQEGRICLWFMCDPTKASEDRVIEIFGTGHPIESAIPRDFLGTVQQGEFVWHIFARPNNGTV